VETKGQDRLEYSGTDNMIILKIILNQQDLCRIISNYSGYGSVKGFRCDIDKSLSLFNNQATTKFKEDLHFSIYQPSGISVGQMVGWVLVGWSVTALPISYFRLTTIRKFRLPTIRFN
jgi:hypothetical protein